MCRPRGSACRRARRCASARPTRRTRNGCDSCATRPTSSCGLTNAKPLIALTSGEPAGIGPELCVRVAREAALSAHLRAELVVLGDGALLAGCPRIEHVPLARPVTPGRLDAANARYVLAPLDRAVKGCLSGEYAAMVTAPVQKSVIN